ncbi:MAG: HslU--HslV peptidase ATPase subunit, partial [Phycisphaerales bacterium]
VALIGTEGVKVEFTDDAVAALADIAFRVNEGTENIGARRLMTVMEELMEDLSFEAPDRSGESVYIDEAYVSKRLAD